jgi:hypothetical protein
MYLLFRRVLRIFAWETIGDLVAAPCILVLLFGALPSYSQNRGDAIGGVAAFLFSGQVSSAVTSARFVIQEAPVVVVTPASSTLSSSQVLSIAVSASGRNGVPSGSVTLTTGGYTSAATALSNGAASFNIPAGVLTAGTDVLTASYVPDTASQPVYRIASGTAPVTVSAPVSGPVSGPGQTAPTFSILVGGNIALNSGSATGNTATISISPSGGFTGTVNLACSITSTAGSASVAPTCSLSPSVASIAGASAAVSTLTVVTAAPSARMTAPFCWPLAPAAGLALIFFFGIPARRLGRGWPLAMLLVATLSLAGLGCANKGTLTSPPATLSSGTTGSPQTGSSGTTPGSYTVIVKATSGSIAQVASIPLTVSN